MELTKLCILIEKPDTVMEFGAEGSASDSIYAMFNPAKITLSRTIGWAAGQANQHDIPPLHYTGSNPVTLSLDLMFDTYDSPLAPEQKVSVRTFTDKLLYLTTVEGHGSDKHRPPLCQLVWGTNRPFFTGVLSQLETNFTMFLPNGTPVRATAHTTFTSWRAASTDRLKQDLMSSDVAKTWIVQHGQTLAIIAAQEYGDPREWRAIAEANGIDDPLALPPGLTLLLPRRRPRLRPTENS